MRLQELFHGLFQMAFGHLLRGPLAVLKETWCGELELPLDMGKGAGEFPKNLQDKLQLLIHMPNHIPTGLRRDMLLATSCVAKISVLSPASKF